MADKIFDQFREHSVAEFFKKNRQMLGFSGKVRSLTIVVHELVTNSLKHGFPSGRDGSIRIRFVALPGDGRQLEVADDGVGMPDAVDPYGSTPMGLRLVHDLVRQIGGRVSMDGSEGTCVTITFSGHGA